MVSRIFNPMRDGETISCGCGDDGCYKAIEVIDDALIVYEDLSDKEFGDCIVFDLPDGYALCQWTDVPRPDWSQAPDWANWWAVDPNGYACWYQEEPVLSLTVGYCGWVAKTINGVQQGNALWAQELDLELGIDWRLLKMERPTP